MRNDLPANFQDKMDSHYREPIQLLVFNFPSPYGKTYISDRDITIGTNLYKGLVEDWGSLTDSADQKEETGETTEITITFFNKNPFSHITLDRFSDIFGEFDPEHVVVELYQWFAGLSSSDMVLIDKFIIQDPISLDEKSTFFSLDLVSRNILYDGDVGTIVDKDSYPYALESEYGKGIDLIVGSPGQVRALAIKVPLSCTLAGSIAKNSINIEVNEDLIELGFPTSGYLYIEEEEVRYSNITSSKFVVWQNGSLNGRGYNGTEKKDHSSGCEIVQKIFDHTFIVGDVPLASISNVLLDKKFVPNSKHPYVVSKDTYPPTITFTNGPPFYSTFASSITSKDQDFGKVIKNTGNAFWDTSNDAIQVGANIYDDSNSSAAILDRLHPILSITREPPPDAEIPDYGHIVSAFLEVTHWPTAYYEADVVEVIVEGLNSSSGSPFYLSRPSKQDIIDIVIDYNSSHDHGKPGIDDHAHGGNSDTQLILDEHGHAISGGDTSTMDGTYSNRSSFPLGSALTLYSYSTSLYDFGYMHFDFSSGIPTGFKVHHTDATINGVIRRGVAWFFMGGANINVYNDGTLGSIENFSVDLSYFNKPNEENALYGIDVKGRKLFDNDLPLQLYITSVKYTVYCVRTSAPQISNSNVPINTLYTNTAVNPKTGLATSKNVNWNDPEGLHADFSNAAPGRTFTDRFDLTDSVNTRTWDWFWNKKVRFKYVDKSSTDDPLIMLVDAKFVIEYKAKENVYTNEVYCEPIAKNTSIGSNRPDKVIQYLLNKVGVPDSDMGSIYKNIPIWEDENDWVDSQTWKDTGANLDTRPDTPFDVAAERYIQLGYTLNGLIPATKKVREAIKDICLQTRSRLIWTAGKAKLTTRENLQSWVLQDTIPLDEVQLKSITSERQKMSDLKNYITINYNKDNAEDSDKYLKSIIRTNSKSILAHGQKSYTYDFYLIKDVIKSSLTEEGAMAKSLADFYLDQFGLPSTFFEVTTYLNNFFMEKTDVISVASPFNQLSLRACEIRSITREFGSGKNKKINTIKFLLESLNFKIKKAYLPEIPEDGMIYVTDAIRIADLMEDKIVIRGDINIIYDMVLDQEELGIEEIFEMEANYNSKIYDTISTLHMDDDCSINWEIKLYDDIIINVFDFWLYENIGFATRPFMEVRFGGVLPIYGPNYEGIRVYDFIDVKLN